MIVPAYHSAVRRRARQLQRLVGAARRFPVWKNGVMVPSYWWDGHPNFGDTLTPWLLPHYGVIPVYREPRHARLSGVGSVLEFMPETFDGVIWGSGLMNDRERTLPAATPLAVRGPLTAERLGLRETVAFGDPGILVSRHIPRSLVTSQIVAVPHGHHRSHPGLSRLLASEPGRAKTANVHQGARGAVREISAGAVVLTTSLHGLITADSYGIPAVWTMLTPALEGADFKFRDYEATVIPGRSRFVAFDDLRTLDDVVRHASAADPDRVSVVSDDVAAAARRIPVALADLARFPRGLPRALLG